MCCGSVLMQNMLSQRWHFILNSHTVVLRYLPACEESRWGGGAARGAQRKELLGG